MKVINTACPRNCYSTCSFQVEVEENRIVGFRPQPMNIATSEGPCLKGLSYAERQVSKERIIYPLKKEGNVFKRVSWEEVYGLIGSKLNFYKNRFGPQSILYYAASGMSGLVNELSSNFWKMFGGATTVYGNLCWPAGLEATRLTLGANKHNLPEDLVNAKLIVLWGKNPAETNIHQMVFINKAIDKGAKLLVIDPRLTPSSERADLVLRPKPGTDGLLAMSIAKIIIEKDLIDKDFINGNVLGFEEYWASLEKIEISNVVETCGVSEENIYAAAHLIGSISPMTLVPGYGMQRYSNGGQTIRCLLALSVITGNVGKPGACWHYANLQSYVFDKIKEPESYYPDPEKDLPFRRIIPTAKLGDALLNIDDPPIKMAWVERGNPITQNPDSNKTKKAFDNIEFKVVVEQFMTDTAQIADLVLPAKSMFEQSDIIGSYWNPYVQLKQKVFDPPGEVKPESMIYFELAQSMGYKKEEIVQWIPNHEHDIDDWLKKSLLEFPGLIWEDLQNGPVLAPGLEPIPFSDGHFDTPSGKIELFSQQAAQNWNISPLPEYVSISQKKKFPFYLMSPNTKNRIHSQFGNLLLLKQLDPAPVIYMHPHDTQKKGIQQGEIVRIYNENGSLELPVKIESNLLPGTVVIFNGYWHSEGGSPNTLSKGLETDIGHGTAFHDTMVDIEKIA